MGDGEEPRNCILKTLGQAQQFSSTELTGTSTGSEFSVAGRHALFVRHSNAERAVT